MAIGGGTGLSTMLRGLKRHTNNLTAIVTVADDGCGMTPEKLEEVQREVAGDLGQISEGGFGLPNIQKRIQLAYGADYGIHVSSRLGCGTRVTLQIPAKS
mgnify:CR=1 FL=1